VREDVDVRRTAGVMSGEHGEPLRDAVIVGRLNAAQESGILEAINI
jgi:hypothetical protein